MSKTYRILISKPGRYGQKPSDKILTDLGGRKAARFATRADAEREITRIKGLRGYTSTPEHIRPSYKIV